jgi:hypothetical protein
MGDLAMARQSKSQKDTVGRVMHEFKHGELETRGRKVRNPKQAIAIALHEAGASRDQSPSEQKTALRRTKAKERQDETAQARKEGSTRREGASKESLYAEARKRGVPGRSRMSKAELERALHH